MSNLFHKTRRKPVPHVIRFNQRRNVPCGIRSSLHIPVPYSENIKKCPSLSRSFRKNVVADDSGNRSAAYPLVVRFGRIVKDNRTFGRIPSLQGIMNGLDPFLALE